MTFVLAGFSGVVLASLNRTPPDIAAAERHARSVSAFVADWGQDRNILTALILEVKAL